jgi:hypothetical protein
MIAAGTRRQLTIVGRPSVTTVQQNVNTVMPCGLDSSEGEL